jgi:WD40 repeat protein/DNA-binding SARP family transcriptional activator/tRNA A-37 threonylcarbamoyl transferase component Bud32
MPRLKITLLGHFTASLDDAPVETFAYDKVRALLAYLVVEAATPHSREHVADLLWPGYPERSARQNLSQALSTLRGALGDRDNDPPFLLADYRELQFNPACDLWLDIDALTAHLNAVQTHTHAALSECAPCIAHLEAAADLYRGDFLADLLVDDSAPFEEWALLKRESLRRQTLDALEQLTEGHLQHGDAATALKYARRQLELDAWREPAHRQVMRALVLSGQRTAAVAHYEECRHALATGLGVEPEAATLELAHMLKSNTLPDGTRVFAGAASSKADLVGRAVGNYLIVEHLGHGGMAHVYKAYHTRLARYVALKFIRPELLEPVALRAFEKEAKTLASLNHPNVIQVYDFGEIEDATRQPYLVLEFVTGQSLADWLPKGEALPLEQVWPILQQVSAALDYAHAHGVIHRDIKPGNVMLTPDGHALLGDFGISKLLRPGEDAAHTVATTGTPAYMAPEQVDHSLGTIGPAADVYALGVVAYEMLTGHRPFEADNAITEMVRRVQADPTPPRQHVAGLPIAVEQVLLKALARDPQARYAQAGAFAQALGLAAPQALPESTEAWWPHLAGEPAPAPGDPPFKGLQHFDVADADLFFGREALTTRLVRQVTPVAPHDQRAGRARFLAVIGASGSGKSSLVRAGLVAALQRGAVSPDVPPCTAYILTPTAHPLEALALALTHDSASLTAATTLIDDLARDPRSLRLYLKKQEARSKRQEARSKTENGNPASCILPPASCIPHLLVIDQFEEIFTLCRAPAERKAFIANLLNAAQGDGADVFVVITLRADFYEHCAHYPDLREAVSQRQVYIGPMTADGLRHAIEEPAQRSGWMFEPGLVDLLLRDIGAGDGQQPEPGALPLLSHALLETWKRRRGYTLTLGGYAEAGGVRGAIAKTAEAVYQQLDVEQQTVARNIFLRLTELGEGTQDTRRRVTLAELRAQHAGAEVVDGVLARLADARLITTEQETAQVAHEALIREWPTLRGWLEADREGLRLHRHLTEAAQAWAQLGRDPGELYRGARLAQAAEWASAHTTALNAMEQEFLVASQTEAERAEAEREAQRQRELDAARKLAETEKARAEESRFAARKLQGRARALAFAAVGILVVALLAALQWNQARLTAQKNATLANDNANIAATAVAVSELEAAQRAAAETARSAEEAARIEADEQRKAAETAQAEEARQRIAAEAAKTEAISQTRLAQVNLMTLLSDQLVEEHHDLSLLLAAQANTMLDTPATRSSVLTRLESNPSFAGFLDAGVGGIWALAFSPDGQYLAVSGNNTAIRLWNLSTRQPIGELLTGHHSDATALAFSPDGAYLASGACAWYEAAESDEVCDRGELILWDVSTGQATFYSDAHDERVRRLVFNPTGTLLASMANDAVILWDVATAQPVHKFERQRHINDLTFSPDGSLLAMGGCEIENGEFHCIDFPTDVILWNVERAEIERQISGEDLVITKLAFSADGRLLASAGCNRIDKIEDTVEKCTAGRIQLWDVANGQMIVSPIPAHTDWVQGLNFAYDDAVLISVGKEKSIRSWNVMTGEPLAPAVNEYGLLISQVAINPAGTLLATASELDTQVHLWDIAQINQVDKLRTATIFTRSPAPLLAMAVNPGETLLAAAGSTDQIYLWDINNGEAVGDPLTGHTDVIQTLAFSPDGATLASGSADTTLRLWDVGAGQSILPPLEGHTNSVRSVAFSPDGTLLASGGHDNSVRLWDTHTGQPLGPDAGVLATFEALVWKVTFSPDGSMLAAAVAIPEKMAILWDISDVTTPKVLARFPTDAAGGATQVVFSPDGKILAVGTGLAGTVVLWDTQTYQLIGAPIKAHQFSTWPIVFSPDGTTLASGSLDNTIRLIDVATGQLIGPPLMLNSQAPYGSFGTVSSLAFVADGKVLLSSSINGLIRRWNVDPASWRKQVCFLAGRNLAQAEWARYLPDVPYEKTCPQWPAGE